MYYYLFCQIMMLDLMLIPILLYCGVASLLSLTLKQKSFWRSIISFRWRSFRRRSSIIIKLKSFWRRIISFRFAPFADAQAKILLAKNNILSLRSFRWRSSKNPSGEVLYPFAALKPQRGLLTQSAQPSTIGAIATISPFAEAQALTSSRKAAC